MNQSFPIIISTLPTKMNSFSQNREKPFRHFCLIVSLKNKQKPRTQKYAALIQTASCIPQSGTQIRGTLFHGSPTTVPKVRMYNNDSPTKTVVEILTVM